jgi:hypothetical protein
MIDIKKKIKAFKPWRDRQNVLHFPERLAYGGMQCGCGQELDCNVRKVSNRQPWPGLAAGFESFMQHVIDRGYDRGESA